MKHSFKVPTTEEEKKQRSEWAKNARAARSTKVKVPTAIRLLPEHLNALKAIGDGNLSLGIKIVCERFNLVLNTDDSPTKLDYLKK